MAIFPIVGDESVDFPVLEALKDAGFPVYAIVLERPGSTDPEVLKIAQEQNALLLTADKDFGLLVRHKSTCSGVVLLRLHTLSPDEMASRVESAFAEHSKDLLGCFTVIQEKQIRIRPLPE